MCNGPNTCVDFLRLDFPTYNDREITCGLMSELGNLMGFDGMTALDAEFVTNRAVEQPGMLLYVYCNTPEFDMNYSSKLDKKKRNVEDCTSPNGMGPRDEPLLPPPVTTPGHLGLLKSSICTICIHTKINIWVLCSFRKFFFNSHYQRVHIVIDDIPMQKIYEI